MLTGIPSTDFTLTRDFLVMQDEQINVINSFKNQNMEIEENNVALSSTTDGANKENNNLIISECDKEQFSKAISPIEKKKAVEKKDVRRSKRHITDKKDFCKHNSLFYMHLIIYILINTYNLFLHILHFLQGVTNMTVIVPKMIVVT